MKKIVIGIMLTLLLVGVWTSTFNLTIAGVDETESIEPDETTSIPVTQAVDWWPMFHHDLNHTGYSTSLAPNTNHTIWNYTTGGWVHSSPAVVDCIVYIGSNDDNVYALNYTTGAKIWNYTTGDNVGSSPAVADGRVYVGSEDSHLYCLNASTGEHIWNRTLDDEVTDSPAVADGRVYVPNIANRVYCLNASDGTNIWNYTIGPPGDPACSPAVAEGKVYIGESTGQGSQDKAKLYCLNASDGTSIWNYTADTAVESSPAFADDRVYFGSHLGTVYCLNASTGEYIWDYSTANNVHSSPAVAYGRVYVGSADYNVTCLDALDGTRIWNYTTGGQVQSSPAVADGKVYVGSGYIPDNRIFCLDAFTGAKIWAYETGGNVHSSPAVADGKVYVGSGDGKIYAFGPPIHDVALTNVTVSKTIVCQNYTMSINATVENQGNYTENVEVTAYANTASIQTLQITNLHPRNSTNLTFLWNTTGFDKGDYTISVNATIIICNAPSSDRDASDNNYTNGMVEVHMVGDIAPPYELVDIVDIVKVAIAFGSQKGDPNYNPNADINDDAEIDIIDIVIVAIHFGETE